MRRLTVSSWLTLCLISIAGGAAAEAPAVYLQHCASCHGEHRLGAIGPALLPGNLKRLRRAQATTVIAEGRAASQMPGFGHLLNDTEIASLVEFIYTPVLPQPDWTAQDIRTSHVLYSDSAQPVADQPVFDADPLNLFVVVESGDHHATIVDGTRFEALHRFQTRFALHGGPKFSPDGRYVYFGSRDGWVSKFDLYTFTLVAEVRAGINMRNIAISSDGQYVLAANYLPHTLVLLDAETLRLRDVIATAGSSGRTSRVSAVYDAPPRSSFIVALKDIPEVWELPYGDAGNESRSHQLDVRRIELDAILDDFFFDPDYELIFGASRDGGGQVVGITDGRSLAHLPLDGLPHLGSGISWTYQGRRVVATPNLKQPVVSVIDIDTHEVVKQIETLGPGFFMRSHEHSPYAWVDVFFGPHRDAVHVIDKRTLDIVRTLRPAPGKTAAHVEFTRDGRYALLSIWDMQGAVVVYDAHTLEEVKRLPMTKPSGKYNVWNKISGSIGTSH